MANSFKSSSTIFIPCLRCHNSYYKLIHEISRTHGWQSCCMREHKKRSNDKAKEIPFSHFVWHRTSERFFFIFSLHFVAFALALVMLSQLPQHHHQHHHSVENNNIKLNNLVVVAYKIYNEKRIDGNCSVG